MDGYNPTSAKPLSTNFNTISASPKSSLPAIDPRGSSLTPKPDFNI